MVVTVCSIRCGNEWVGVDDQHGSVATETVSEQLVDSVADAVLAGSDSRNAQFPAAWHSIEMRGVLGEHLGSEFLCRHPARRGGCFQTASNLAGDVHGYRHTISLRVASPTLLLTFPGVAVGLAAGGWSWLVIRTPPSGRHAVRT